MNKEYVAKLKKDDERLTALLLAHLPLVRYEFDDCIIFDCDDKWLDQMTDMINEQDPELDYGVADLCQALWCVKRHRIAHLRAYSERPVAVALAPELDDGDKNSSLDADSINTIDDLAAYWSDGGTFITEDDVLVTINDLTQVPINDIGLVTIKDLSFDPNETMLTHIELRSCNLTILINLEEEARENQ